MADTNTLKDGDRISHEIKGLGTVRMESRDIADLNAATPPEPGTVPVVWDDDRFPVENVPRAELEKVPDASAAISTGV